MYHNTEQITRRLKEFKVLKEGNTALLYDRETLNVRPLENSESDALEKLIQEVDYLPQDSDSWASIESILERCTNFNAVPVHKPALRFEDNTVTDKRAEVDSAHYLNKLAINIANDCNLGCTYCYANKGVYGTPQKSLMSTKDIEAVVTKFAEQFDYIERVQFMGGEPSMNPEAIAETTKVFQNLVGEGKLHSMPAFNMVTNGVSFSNRFLELVKKHRLELTISLDGPKDIHDFIRVRKNGQGSYDAIRRNIIRAKELGAEIDFEATFSKRHLDCGVSLINLCEWFYREFGVGVLHAPPMSMNRYGTEPLGLSIEEKTREFCNVTVWGLNNVLEKESMVMHSFTARLLESFLTKIKNTTICPAGNSLLSVSTQGDIFPCWMYTDEEPFLMGNIRDENCWGEKGKEVIDNIQKNELHSHPDCTKCWIQPVCFGCKGGDWHATGMPDGKTDCDYMRAMVFAFVTRLFRDC